jgi:cytochrome P450
MMEAVLLLATIARRFSLRLQQDRAVELLPAMSLRPKGGVWVTLEAR